jgi:hypothetical protein
MRLIDGDVRGCAVDLARRYMDDSRRFGTTRRLEDVQGAEGIGEDELPRMAIRVWDRNEGSEMEDAVTPAGRIRNRLGIYEVATEDLDLRCDLGVAALEPPVVVARVVAHKSPHARIGLHERLGEMASDESRRPCDEHIPARPRHLLWAPL